MTPEHTEKPNRDPGVGYIEVRDYFTLWLERLEQHYDQRFADLDKAVTKAESAAEKRFEAVNEFRKALSDQTGTFVTRAEYEGKHTNLQTTINNIADEIQNKRESDSNRQETFKLEKQRWVVPLFVLGLIQVINLLISIFWLLKK